MDSDCGVIQVKAKINFGMNESLIGQKVDTSLFLEVPRDNELPPVYI